MYTYLFLYNVTITFLPLFTQFIIDSSLKSLNLKTEQTIESIMFIPYSSSLLLTLNQIKHVKRHLCKTVKAPKANTQLLVKIHADSKNVALLFQRLHFIFSVKRSVKGSMMLNKKHDAP